MLVDPNKPQTGCNNKDENCGDICDCNIQFDPSTGCLLLNDNKFLCFENFRIDSDNIINRNILLTKKSIINIDIEKILGARSSILIANFSKKDGGCKSKENKDCGCKSKTSGGNYYKINSNLKTINGNINIDIDINDIFSDINAVLINKLTINNDILIQDWIKDNLKYKNHDLIFWSDFDLSWLEISPINLSTNIFSIGNTSTSTSKIIKNNDSITISIKTSIFNDDIELMISGNIIYNFLSDTLTNDLILSIGDKFFGDLFFSKTISKVIVNNNLKLVLDFNFQIYNISEWIFFNDYLFLNGNIKSIDFKNANSFDELANIVICE